jgi:hypothetical protein
MLGCDVGGCNNQAGFGFEKWWVCKAHLTAHFKGTMDLGIYFALKKQRMVEDGTFGVFLRPEIELPTDLPPENDSLDFYLENEEG